ncbi:MAG TPA: guanylate kinase [Planctomycetota bacterium]|nr:guanylate kinase [Planctomycetota bacterium]
MAQRRTTRRTAGRRGARPAVPSPRPGSLGVLLIVSGPGGAGKTTLCEKLSAMSGGRVALSISCTTRAPRGGEVDGRHYHFISRQAFRRAAAAGRFAEHAEVAGNFYGTPRPFLEEQLAAGHDVLLDIDVQGGDAVRRLYGSRAVSIFVLPPSRRILEERLRGRGTDSPERVRARMELAEREIARAGDYDYLVINGRQEEAIAEIDAIRRAEHARITREGSGASWALKTWS